uniref:Proline-rich receptor-like protein kinase PERK3 n=1 Tax=Sedum alfredii TaxID=439688 RepID=A0A650AVG9_9MAGN|nr:Proline-rich receptor-like protein kinase PERK3 [Sedum alfredii]
MSECRKVVVIQDLSRETSLKGIRALKGLPLEPGDEITFLGILHQVNNPMGYKMKADNANPLIVEEEFSRKTDEYNCNVHNTGIVRHWKNIQIRVEVKVIYGPSAKKIALAAAKDLGATWVILDRQMKRDKKYFIDELPKCRISRLKRDNTIEELQRMKLGEEAAVERVVVRNVTYGDMIPGTTDKSPEKDCSDSKKRPNLAHFQQPESVKITPEVMNAAPEVSGSGSTGSHLLQSAEQKSISLPADEKGEEFVKPDFIKLSPPLVGKITESVTLLLTTTASSSSLVNTEASSSSQTDAKTTRFHHSDGLYTTNTELEELSPQTMISPDSPYLDHSDYEEFPGLYQTKDVFKNSVCSCGNRRPIIGWSKEFRYAELNKATEGFAPKNFLSEGGFGSVYRGRLKNGMYVAVKQHKHASLQGEKEFKSEVNVLSKARNENVVMLLGSCTEGTNRLLVYEYVCNGSLDQLLSKLNAYKCTYIEHSRRPFRWEKRIKIASGAARGLKYLHENSIIHRDVRPNNILVTHDHESLLGDFGLARAHEADHSSETRVVGTLGYLAPEYAESGKVSTKTDVYAFGVVLLQLITGFTTNDKQLKGRSLVGWARPLLKEGNYPLLVDERISEYYDVHHLYWMVRVAEKCLSKDPQKRPTMATVVQILDYLANGDPTSSVKAFSPAQSDTISVAESNVSDEDTEAEIGSTFSGRSPSVSNRSKLSGKYSPLPGYESSTRRQSVLAMSKLAAETARKEKARGIMRVKSSLHYNEMVD